MTLRDGALAQLGERLLCKHQVIGSIPIGSTMYFAKRSELLTATRFPEMKRTRIPVVDTGRDGAIGALPIFDIVNGFFKSMP